MGETTTVSCNDCGKTETVVIQECLAEGWPRCCGYTMTVAKDEDPKKFNTAADEHVKKQLVPLDHIFNRKKRNV